MLFSAMLSLAVAEVMHDKLDVLASLVNFGAHSAFIFRHLSVVARMAWKQGSRRYVAHWGVPILGITVVASVLCGMAPATLMVGGAWLVLGITYALFMRHRAHRESAATDLDCT
jgi:hypothetical protein